MPNAAALQEFKNFPFLDDNTIANLAAELPAYLAAVDGIVDLSEQQKLAWWAARRHTLPHWASLVRKLLLIQPSSAASERVFSLLSTLSSQQDNALEDYHVEASVMIRYNECQRRNEHFYCYCLDFLKSLSQPLIYYSFCSKMKGKFSLLLLGLLKEPQSAASHLLQFSFKNSSSYLTIIPRARMGY